MAVITNHFFCLQKETRASVLKVHNKLINTSWIKFPTEFAFHCQCFG